MCIRDRYQIECRTAETAKNAGRFNKEAGKGSGDGERKKYGAWLVGAEPVDIPVNAEGAGERASGKAGRAKCGRDRRKPENDENAEKGAGAGRKQREG